jgi:hypothetical protein
MYIPDPCSSGNLSAEDQAPDLILLSMYRSHTDARLFCSSCACFSHAAQFLETALPTMAEHQGLSGE